jgi:hypothetical protein
LRKGRILAIKIPKAHHPTTDSSRVRRMTRFARDWHLAIPGKLLNYLDMIRENLPSIVIYVTRDGDQPYRISAKFKLSIVPQLFQWLHSWHLEEGA